MRKLAFAQQRRMPTEAGLSILYRIPELNPPTARADGALRKVPRSIGSARLMAEAGGVPVAL